MGIVLAVDSFRIGVTHTQNDESNINAAQESEALVNIDTEAGTHTQSQQHSFVEMTNRSLEHRDELGSLTLTSNLRKAISYLIRKRQRDVGNLSSVLDLSSNQKDALLILSYADFSLNMMKNILENQNTNDEIYELVVNFVQAIDFLGRFYDDKSDSLSNEQRRSLKLFLKLKQLLPVQEPTEVTLR